MLKQTPTALPDHLVASSDLVEALDRLMTGVSSAYFEVKRGWLNLANGTEQSTTVVLDVAEMTDATGQIDRRLLSASRVGLFLTWPDNGFAVVDLTARAYVSYGSSEAMQAALDRFKSDLKELDGHRRTSRRYIGWSHGGPFLIAIGLLSVISLMPPPVGGDPGANGELEFSEFPPWSEGAFGALFYLWIFLACISVWIGVQRMLGGGMLVWPTVLNRASLATVLHQMYVAARSPGYWKKMGWLVLGAAFAGFFAAAFTAVFN